MTLSCLNPPAWVTDDSCDFFCVYPMLRFRERCRGSYFMKCLRRPGSMFRRSTFSGGNNVSTLSCGEFSRSWKMFKRMTWKRYKFSGTWGRRFSSHVPVATHRESSIKGILPHTAATGANADWNSWLQRETLYTHDAIKRRGKRACQRARSATLAPPSKKLVLVVQLVKAIRKLLVCLHFFTSLYISIYTTFQKPGRTWDRLSGPSSPCNYGMLMDSLAGSIPRG